VPMGDWFGTLFVLCFVFVFLSTNNIATLDYTLDFFLLLESYFFINKALSFETTFQESVFKKGLSA